MYMPKELLKVYNTYASTTKMAKREKKTIQRPQPDLNQWPKLIKVKDSHL